ncbi:hypothetical protein MAE02_61100 [Microvirga aerophila]|uniref:Uncharacterized protein n=1 Tax=Microvirga aerophila TaxID=670291 RepID=A0A512C2H0_9HYPH|nr:hypothetical protein MAE02_61100 [Microvirga aerophila]
MSKIIGNGRQAEASESKPDTADNIQKPTAPVEASAVVGDKVEDRLPVQRSKIIRNG